MTQSTDIFSLPTGGMVQLTPSSPSWTTSDGKLVAARLARDSRNAPGFDEEHYFQMPSGATGNLIYRDKTASVWSIAPTDVNANCDSWIGFYYDGGDGVLYSIGADTSTAPDTYYTVSINSAGTITNIGNAQPTTGTANVWPDTMVTRSANSTGNLFIRTGFLEIEINVSTGAITTDVATIIETSESTAIISFYKSEDGGHYAAFPAAVDPASTPMTLFVGVSGKLCSIQIYQDRTGFSQGTIASGEVAPHITLWDNRVRILHRLSSSSGPNGWPRARFDAWLAGLISHMGVSA